MKQTEMKKLLVSLNQLSHKLMLITMKSGIAFAFVLMFSLSRQLMFIKGVLLSTLARAVSFLFTCS